jgi:energy-coupling factor transport system ATP-binding protein
MPLDAPFIHAEALSHLFPAQPQPIPALQDITLALRRGEYVAVVGANGSGKSTLARHFNALLYPTSGDVWVNDANTRDASRLRAIRHNVAMVFQNPENQFVATVAEEDVAFGPENFGVPQPALGTRVSQALQVVGLAPLRLRAPHELSAGQQQRLAVAGALALEPSALVLDEATSMLDPRGKQEVSELAGRLHEQGLLLVAITQAMDEAASAERIVVLDHGRIAARGTHAEVLEASDVYREIYEHGRFERTIAEQEVA